MTPPIWHHACCCTQDKPPQLNCCCPRSCYDNSYGVACPTACVVEIVQAPPVVVDYYYRGAECISPGAVEEVFYRVRVQGNLNGLQFVQSIDDPGYLQPFNSCVFPGLPDAPIDNDSISVAEGGPPGTVCDFGANGGLGILTVVSVEPVPDEDVPIGVSAPFLDGGQFPASRVLTSAVPHLERLELRDFRFENNSTIVFDQFCRSGFPGSPTQQCNGLAVRFSLTVAFQLGTTTAFSECAIGGNSGVWCRTYGDGWIWGSAPSFGFTWLGYELCGGDPEQTDVFGEPCSTELDVCVLPEYVMQHGVAMIPGGVPPCNEGTVLGGGDFDPVGEPVSGHTNEDWRAQGIIRVTW